MDTFTTVDITNPSSPVNVTPFNQAEARQFTDELKRDISELNDKLLEGYRRRVWKALNYDNFVDYCQCELGESKTNAYRLLDAARVTNDLFPEFGNQATKLPVSHRELLLKVPSGQRSDTLKEAIHLAQLEGKKAPTANHVRRVIRQRLGEESQLKNLERASGNLEEEFEETGDDAFAQLKTDWERQFAEIEALKSQLEQQTKRADQLQREVLDLMGQVSSQKSSLTVGDEVGKRLEGWRGYIREINGDRVKVWWAGDYIGKKKEEKWTIHNLADLCPFPSHLLAINVGQTCSIKNIEG